MIFEPILNAPLMKVVLKVARQCHYVLFCLEFSQTDTALILIGELLWVPFDIEHFLKHFSCFALLLANTLGSLESLIQEVWDKTGKEDCTKDE